MNTKLIKDNTQEKSSLIVMVWCRLYLGTLGSVVSIYLHIQFTLIFILSRGVVGVGPHLFRQLIAAGSRQRNNKLPST